MDSYLFVMNNRSICDESMYLKSQYMYFNTYRFRAYRNDNQQFWFKFFWEILFQFLEQNGHVDFCRGPSRKN